MGRVISPFSIAVVLWGDYPSSQLILRWSTFTSALTDKLGDYFWIGITIVKAPYVQLMQKRLGSTSIGASTARGMGPKGTIQKSREYLQSLDLRRFNLGTSEAFEAELERATLELMKAMPKEGRHWGSARKFLNIFLRHCLYNQYLCKTFQLKKIERWLEVPLDSHVAKRLRAEDGGKSLPRWQTVIGLHPHTSVQYQAFAKKVAKAEGVSRVHLDVKYWRSVG